MWVLTQNKKVLVQVEKFGIRTSRFNVNSFDDLDADPVPVFVIYGIGKGNELTELGEYSSEDAAKSMMQHICSMLGKGEKSIAIL